MKGKAMKNNSNSGGNLLPGTGKGGVHKSRKRPTGKQLRKRDASRVNRGWN